MVKIIYGTKGTGKTKQIIDQCNATVESAKGNVVYITDTPEHSLEVKHSVRYINTKDYLINSQDRLIGFLGGLMAGNTDIEFVFIDGVARMTDTSVAEQEALYNFLGKLSDEFGTTFVLTVSSDVESMPNFIKKYIA
ncbi:MAG: hypothetical protein IJF71_02500 [Clostridia bacterium]|nr:hypothetical protein [Clostridia bacterium]